MKKVIIGVVMIVMLTCAVVVWAADEQAAKEQTPQSTSRGPAAQMRGRGPAMSGAGGMQQAYQELLKKRTAEHQKGIAELEEIKKIAESEKAKKTAEALQKMIDQKNAEFKKSMEDAEKQRTETMERIKQHQKEMAAKKAENQPVKPEDKAKEKVPAKKAEK
jgi:hypothetical protein